VRPNWQTRTVLAGLALIIFIAIAPSIRAVWLNAWRLLSVWEHTFWFTPALYLYAFASMMAISMPVASAARCLPLLRAEDARPRVLVTILLSSFAIALGTAVFWQLAAWASYPLLKDGQLRLLPLYPWPDYSFFREFLGLSA
jgi:hypothetical protein